MSILYTALFGGSDSLKAAPAGPDECLCFTDNLSLDPNGWTLLYWPTKQPRWEARVVKMSSHLLFPAEKWTVWADASMTITDWNLLLHDAGNHYVSCLEHPDRANVYSEAIETMSMVSQTDPKLIQRLLRHFKDEKFVSTSLSTAGLMVRRLSQNVIDFNSLWRQCLDKYGIDDQLQFDYCCWKIGLKPHYLTGHYRENPYMVYDHSDHATKRSPQYARKTI